MKTKDGYDIVAVAEFADGMKYALLKREHKVTPWIVANLLSDNSQAHGDYFMTREKAVEKLVQRFKFSLNFLAEV